MSNWISVKDKLPEKEGKYWTAKIITKDCMVYDISPFGKVGNEMAFYSGYPVRFRNIVDAWMPIEPYKENGEPNEDDAIQALKDSGMLNRL